VKSVKGLRKWRNLFVLYFRNALGIVWLDWAIFHPLRIYLLRAFQNKISSHTYAGYEILFHWLSNVLHLTKDVLGYILGDFSHKHLVTLFWDDILFGRSMYRHTEGTKLLASQYFGAFSRKNYLFFYFRIDQNTLHVIFLVLPTKNRVSDVGSYIDSNIGFELISWSLNTLNINSIFKYLRIVQLPYIHILCW
jgi:hypothetical protein